MSANIACHDGIPVGVVCYVLARDGHSWRAIGYHLQTHGLFRSRQPWADACKRAREAAARYGLPWPVPRIPAEWRGRPETEAWLAGDGPPPWG